MCKLAYLVAVKGMGIKYATQRLRLLQISLSMKIVQIFEMGKELPARKFFTQLYLLLVEEACVAAYDVSLLWYKSSCKTAIGTL